MKNTSYVRRTHLSSGRNHLYIGASVFNGETILYIRRKTCFRKKSMYLGNNSLYLEANIFVLRRNNSYSQQNNCIQKGKAYIKQRTSCIWERGPATIFKLHGPHPEEGETDIQEGTFDIPEGTIDIQEGILLLLFRIFHIHHVLPFCIL